MSNKVKVKISKKTKLGGLRVPLDLPFATQRLLAVLWKKLGGPHALQKKTGVKAQQFIHWRNQGKVSLKAVGPISRKLGVVCEALNYRDVGKFLGSNAVWLELFNMISEDFKFTQAEIEYTRAGKIPKQYGIKKGKK